MVMAELWCKMPLAMKRYQWVEQAEQLGTGHAVKVTLPVLPREVYH